MPLDFCTGAALLFDAALLAAFPFGAEDRDAAVLAVAFGRARAGARLAGAVRAEAGSRANVLTKPRKASSLFLFLPAVVAVAVAVEAFALRRSSVSTTKEKEQRAHEKG